MAIGPGARIGPSQSLGPHRQGRDGRSLSSDGHQSEAGGRPQGAARGGRGRCRPSGTVPTRSRIARGAQPSEHRPDSWAGEVRRYRPRWSWSWSRGRRLPTGFHKARSPSTTRCRSRNRSPKRLTPRTSSGIIHRDLKPANIALTADDQVKVLDFGLAKLAQPEGLTSSDPSASPTITSPAMLTGVGMILGTAAYMSPEQAKGRVVDKRSDVWAFGCVLYEMVTGRRAFPADDVADVACLSAQGRPRLEPAAPGLAAGGKRAGARLSAQESEGADRQPVHRPLRPQPAAVGRRGDSVSLSLSLATRNDRDGCWPDLGRTRHRSGLAVQAGASGRR